MPSERTPLLSSPKSEPEGLSPLAVFGALVKTFTGAGVLALPYAVSRCGIVLGTFFFCFLAAVCRVSCRMLLASRRDSGCSGPDCFADIGREAYGALGRGAVLFSIVAGLWGALVSFNLVIASSLASVFPQLSVRGWLAAACPVLVLLNVSNSRRLVALVSALGNAVLFVSCAAVLAAGYDEWSQGAREGPALAIPEGVGVFFGVATFSFTVQTAVFPMEDAMRGSGPGSPGGGGGGGGGSASFGRVLDWAIGAVLAFYTAFSVAAYAAFGARTQQIVVLNITKGYTAVAVQLSMSAVVALTFPVVGLPLVLTLSSLALPRKADAEAGGGGGEEGSPAAGGPLVAALRVGIVLTTAGCAALFTESFALFTSLVGSFAISLMTTILPPLFYARICGPRVGPLRAGLAVLMALAGAAVAAASAAAVIADLARPHAPHPAP
eukprot:tig00001336_g8238.t1